MTMLQQVGNSWEHNPPERRLDHQNAWFRLSLNEGAFLNGQHFL